MLWDFERDSIYSSDVILRFTEAFNYESIMSGRSVNSSNIIVTTGAGGSVRQHTSGGLPNGVRLAGEESKDKMYEPKHTKKLVRVLTVVAYIFSVSLAAIMLSVYYVFLWNPKDIPHRAMLRTTPAPSAVCPNPLNVTQQNKPPDDAMPLPQIQQPETTVPMNLEALRRSTPLPLLHARLSQQQSRTVPSTVPSPQNINYTDTSNQIQGT